MSLRRWFVAAVSGVAYPSLIVLVVAGMTFTAVEVFAESSVYGGPRCDDDTVQACADAGLYEACDGGENAPFARACMRQTCGDSFATSVVANVCVVMTTCEAGEFAACEGKSADASCEFEPTPRLDGTGCQTRECLEKVGQKYVAQLRLRCEQRPFDAGVVGGGDVPDSGANEDLPSSDSGCSTSAPVLPGTLALTPVAGLLLLWRLRRARRSQR